MLVIDEISMLGCQDFYNVNTQLQRFRDSPQPFGGLLVVLLAGDFMQFGPVLAKSLRVSSSRQINLERKEYRIPRRPEQTKKQRSSSSNLSMSSSSNSKLERLVIQHCDRYSKGLGMANRLSKTSTS